MPLDPARLQEIREAAEAVLSPRMFNVVMSPDAAQRGARAVLELLAEVEQLRGERRATNLSDDELALLGDALHSWLGEYGFGMPKDESDEYLRLFEKLRIPYPRKPPTTT